MGKPSKQLMEFMSKFKIDADEVWEVRTGGAWAIKHSALERVAAEQGIVFDRPAILEINLEKKLMAVCVFGKMGDRTEWSIGESAPYNTKPGYPAAMAEKRAKDRCALKLLSAHGTVYSEMEADEFTEKRSNPHVTRAADIVPDVEYDEHGQPVDNIPHGDGSIDPLPKAKSRGEFEACQKELRATTTVRQLEQWGRDNANRIATLPHDWAQIMRGLYSDHMTDLRAAKQAAQ